MTPSSVIPAPDRAGSGPVAVVLDRSGDVVRVPADDVDVPAVRRVAVVTGQPEQVEALERDETGSGIPLADGVPHRREQGELLTHAPVDVPRPLLQERGQGIRQGDAVGAGAQEEAALHPVQAQRVDELVDRDVG